MVTQMGRTSRKEGIYVNIFLTNFTAQQKLIQHCKAAIFQLKINCLKSKRNCSKSNEVNALCFPYTMLDINVNFKLGS